ncbi:unnamed protein product [Rotaria sp. Silwood2]|nr:unnamed protein product [Rotaria sp. Silwood2]
MNAQEVLRSLVEQIKDKEGLQGLIILEAYYDHLTSIVNESSLKTIDVRIPLQTLMFHRSILCINRYFLISILRTHTISSNTTHFGYDKVPEDEKQNRVNEVFSSVADKSDRMNDVMSFGIHRIWKNYFIQIVRPNPQWNYIDVAGGIGDIAFRYLKELDHYYPSSSIPTPEPSSTPTHTYMAESVEQTRIYPTSKCVIVDINLNMIAVTNAEELLFYDEQFDMYTIAFGIRNYIRIDRVVSEVYRILKKGGRFLCLEFSQANNTLLCYLYDQYSKTFIPPMGQIIAND